MTQTGKIKLYLSLSKTIKYINKTMSITDNLINFLFNLSSHKHFLLINIYSQIILSLLIFNLFFFSKTDANLYILEHEIYEVKIHEQTLEIYQSLSLVMRTFLIYSRINFQIYQYVTFSIFIYFVTGTLQLLTIFSSHYAVHLKLTWC